MFYERDKFATEHEISAAIDRFVAYNGKAKLFDAKAAALARVEKDIIDVGLVYNEMVIGESEADYSQTRVANPLNRWRYCGKNNSGPGAPVNSADEACKRHDNCLAAGTAVCWCDTQFVYDLRRIRNQYSGADRVYIEAAIQAVPRYHGCQIPA